MMKEVTMMHTYRMLFITFLVIVMASFCITAQSQEVLTYSDTELDEILAPIALYPDPLIAQILPAATFPDQLSDAVSLVALKGGTDIIDEQDWDVSVKAIAHYPTVLNMMVDKPEWTTSVGQAYVDEPDHVMISIQRLRRKARMYGYLSTNKYQSVYVDSGYIRIVPVQTQYIYVPEYDPQVVYVKKRSSTSSWNWISFGLGLLIGSWLDRDVDWGHHRVYYHGWTGGGWIGRSRPHVHTNNNYYVNDKYKDRPVEVDHNVKGRDISGYRKKVQSSAGHYSKTNYPRTPRTGGTTKTGPNRRTTQPGTNPFNPTPKTRTQQRSTTNKSEMNPNRPTKQGNRSQQPGAGKKSRRSPKNQDHNSGKSTRR